MLQVKLGFREGDFVEILEGVSDGEWVITVGQDGLAEGTPIKVLNPPGAPKEPGEKVAEGTADEQPRRGQGRGTHCGLLSGEEDGQARCG